MIRKALMPVNKWLSGTILALTTFGLIIFLSAAVGLVVRETGASFRNIVTSQLLFGFLPGLFLMYYLSRKNYKILRSWSFYILVSAVILTIFTFIPGLSFSHGGAQRWIMIGNYTFQPSEFLKIAVIIYLSAWFAVASSKQKADTLQWGTLPFLIVLMLSGIILLLQPDVDTFLVIFVASLSIYLAAGMRLKHFVSLSILGVVLLAVLSQTYPYVQNRIKTYLNPQEDSLGAGYQIQQSLIAVGSGGFTGKGFGKSIQKFNYLPEPVGDSVFAVASEEFGFVGSFIIILLFFSLAHFGLKVAIRVQDNFGKFLAIGIVVMILTQAFINIGAMIGIVPVSGITLPFVSQGGSALLFTLAESGILLSISRSAIK